MYFIFDPLRYALGSGKTYTISLSAYYPYDPSLVGAAEVSVRVGVQDLIATIAGGSGLAHPANSTLVLDASSSYDPDYKGANPGIFF